MWKSNKNRKPIQKGHQWVDGQRAHKMVRSGSQGIPIRRQKTQTNISVISPQNHKWDFSPCPSLTQITSDKCTSYGEMSKVKTTWFESRRGRTEKGILRRKIWMGNMAQKYPPRSPCVHYVAVNYDTVIIYKTVQIHQINSRNLNYFHHKLKFTDLLVVTQAHWLIRFLYTHTLQCILFPSKSLKKTTYSDRIFPYWFSIVV